MGIPSQVVELAIARFQELCRSWLTGLMYNEISEVLAAAAW